MYKQQVMYYSRWNYSYTCTALNIHKTYLYNLYTSLCMHISLLFLYFLMSQTYVHPLAIQVLFILCTCSILMLLDTWVYIYAHSVWNSSLAFILLLYTHTYLNTSTHMLTNLYLSLHTIVFKLLHTHYIITRLIVHSHASYCYAFT